MDGPQFHVDIPALEEVATGIATSVQGQHDFRLDRLPGRAEMYGDAELSKALGGFCDRWSDGLDILTKDARRSATRWPASRRRIGPPTRRSPAP
jgi:hypothetical protein